jgi:signal transduction histidine kinase
VSKRRIQVLDTTLRDGEQSPGIALQPHEKAEIALQLERLGVDVVEAGFAGASPGDFEGVRAVARAVGRPTVASLARAVTEDLDAAAEALVGAGRSRIHIVLATSALHMEKKLGLEPQEVVEHARRSVAYAASLVDEVEFSCEDATRSDPAFAAQMDRSAWPSLREKLAQLLDDPDLVLAYRVADGRFVDHDGRSIVLQRRPTRRITPLARDGEEVAMLEHRPGLEDDPAQMREVVIAARLSLENERLQALAQARLADVRRSRVRIVAAGDEERRSLERDLHDGAQQRLVSLSIALRILRGRLVAAGGASGLDLPASDLLDEADAELRTALSEVREVAHGIYPAALGEEGLAAGVESLVEASPTQVTVDAMTQERFEPPIEVAGYLIVAQGTRQGAGHRARINVRREGGHLVVDVEHDGNPDELATDLKDRIGALDGTIIVETSDHGLVRIHAEIPCAS